MKNRIIPFLAVAGICSVMLSSYHTGPAAGGQNRCGVLGSPTTCGQAGGCHSAAKGTAVTITVDSGSTAVTHYVPGQAYTIKIHGTSTSNNSFFGFQFVSASGTGNAQVQAGVSSGFPKHVTKHNLLNSSSNIAFIEHDSQLIATSPGNYNASFTWTAPSTGTGKITMYCSLNAVNGDGLQDSADISGNTSVVLTQATSGIEMNSNQISLSAFPNPVINTLNMSLENADKGSYTLQVFNLMGVSVANQQLEINATSKTVNLNTNSWAPGVYNIVLEKAGSRKTITVMKL